MKIDNKKLDMLMATNCLTSSKLSELSGVSQPAIARYRRGTQQPRPIAVGKIAKALNCKVEDIIEQDTAATVKETN